VARDERGGHESDQGLTLPALVRVREADGEGFARLAELTGLNAKTLHRLHPQGRVPAHLRGGNQRPLGSGSHQAMVRAGRGVGDKIATRLTARPAGNHRLFQTPHHLGQDREFQQPDRQAHPLGMRND